MAVSYLLKIEEPEIKGESEDKGYKDQLQLQSWSWGAMNTGSAAVGRGLATGKAQFQDFSFSIYLGKASAKLQNSLCQGIHHKTAILTCRKTTGASMPEKYLEIKFEDLVVSSYQTGGSPGDEGIPLESFTMNFAKYTFEYFEQDAKGALKGTGAVTYSVKEAEAKT